MFDEMKFYKMVKDAFFEGWGSYTTHCNAMTSAEDEWKNSDAKKEIEELLGIKFND